MTAPALVVFFPRPWPDFRMDRPTAGAEFVLDGRAPTAEAPAPEELAAVPLVLDGPARRSETPTPERLAALVTDRLWSSIFRRRAQQLEEPESRDDAS
jgi:hypothetical protein